MVSGYRTVAAYSKEKKACEEFGEISDELQKAAIKAQICGGIMGPCMNVISNISFLLVAGFGAYFLIIDFNPLALKGVMTVGTIQAFLQYTKNFTRPINEIAQQYSSIQTAIAGAERVFEIMDTEPESDEGTDKMCIRDSIIADKCKVSDKPESKHRKLSESCEIFNKLSHTKHVQKQCVYCNNRDIETNKTQKE